MNDSGILVSNIVTDLELEKFSIISQKHKIEFGVLPDRSNAIGNNFLINDNGGFSNERLGKRAKDKAEEITDILMENMPVSIFGYYTLLEPYIESYYTSQIVHRTDCILKFLDIATT